MDSPPTKDQFSEQPSWQKHEDYVAALYRRLGYSVQQNINVDGQQVDLLCENWLSGIGLTRLYIDCKHTKLDENRSVSKDDVDQFVYSFRSRADGNGWTAAVMVSNRPFSQYAKAAAAKHLNIHLKTIEELHEEVLRVRSYLYDSIRRYEESNRFIDFVPPYGSEHDILHTLKAPILLEELVKVWLRVEGAQQLCLFGDFGTGKTTFLEFVHYTFAKRYLVDSSVRIPLLIPLRRYYEAADHEEIIAQFFMQECGVNLHYSLFNDFLVKGRFLLLLDGFDEMGARSDPTVRKANYLKLAPLVDGHSKVLISCRPAYFLSLEETRSVFSFVNRQMGFAPALTPGPITEELFGVIRDSDLGFVFEKARSALGGTLFADISLFNSRQIRAYLQKHNSDILKFSDGELDARKLNTRIQEIYDLNDLAQRPLLLKLIVLTLPLFRKASNGAYEIELSGQKHTVPDITPSVLYSVYTEKELEREYKKGKVRWLIARQDKVKAIAAIAFEMFRRDTVALDKGALLQVIQRVFPANDDEQAYYLTDIRTCSFLSRDSQDAARFTHKSFMEYYAAVYIQLGMSNSSNTQDLLTLRPLSDEVAFFLGDSIAIAPNRTSIIALLTELYHRLSSVPAPTETCIQNLLNTFNYARKPVSPLRGVSVSMLVYRKLDIQEQVIEKGEIAILRTLRLSVRKLFIGDSELKRWESEGSILREFIAKSVDCRAMRFWDTRIDSCHLSNCTVQIETWRQCRINIGIFDGTTLINSGTALGSEWMPEKARFNDCILVGLDLRNSAFNNCQFNNCIFVMCLVDRQPKDKLKLEQCRGMVITGDNGAIENWGYGLMCVGTDDAKRFRREPIKKALDWNELLLTAFDPDATPKSGNEVRARLRQVDLALKLNRHRGKLCVVVSPDTPNGSQCRIINCDAHRLTLREIVNNREFQPSLRRTSIQQGARELRIVVEAS